MRHACLATTAFTLLPVSGAGAEQLDFGLRTTAGWNDNVYGVAEDAQLNGEDQDKVDDYSGRVSPFAGISDPDGDLTWSLRYQPSYERYLTENELSGFDHQASGNVTWRFADRWTASLYENYGVFQNPVRFNEANDLGDPIALRVENQEVRSNSTFAVLRHTLSRRNSLVLNAGYNNYVYPDGDGNDRGTPSASFAFEHLWSERTTVGARLSWSQQTYEQETGDDTSQFYNLSGTFEHRFSPTFRVEASAGPAFVDTAELDSDGTVESFRYPLRNISNALFLSFGDGDCNFNGVVNRAGPRLQGCNNALAEPITRQEFNALAQQTVSAEMVDAAGAAFDTSDSGGTDLTYFARIALIKDWENLRGSLIYERSNSDAAAFGSSSVADTFRANLTWKPWRHWTLQLGGAVVLSEQTTDQVVLQEFVLVPDGTGLVEVDNVVFRTDETDAEYQAESVNFTATRQITQYFSVFGSAYWYTQTQDGGGDNKVRSDHLTLWIGFDWAFRPIRF